MARYQIEIDAPIIIELEAPDEATAEEIGDRIYVDVWDALQQVMPEHRRDFNVDAYLGNRYDDTEVIALDPDPR